MSFQPYPRCKPSGVEWLNDVPEHWELKRLRRVASINPSKSETAHLPRTLDVSFLPMEAIGEDGSISLDRVRPLQEVETGYTYFAEGDVILAKITPCFENGKGAVARNLIEGLGFGTTELIVSRPMDGKVTSDFLHWLFCSDRFRQLGTAEMYGAGGQKRVPDDFLRDFVTAWPPLLEQQMISAFLQLECAKIDALREEQQRLIELLKEKRQATITHAVTKGLNPNVLTKPSGVDWLGDVPAHWEVSAVGYRYDVQLGKMLDGARVTGEHLRPYLRVYDVQWRSINTDDLPTMDFDEDAQMRFLLKAGDLLVNEGGSYVGRSAIWRGEITECYYQKALHRLRARDESRDTTCFMLNVMEFATKYGVFVAGGNQTTIDHLTAEQFRRQRFAFPPLSEQLEISAYLDREISRFDLLTEAAQHAIDLLQERRSAVISAAVTGKIDVRHVAKAAASSDNALVPEVCA